MSGAKGRSDFIGLSASQQDAIVDSTARLIAGLTATFRPRHNMNWMACDVEFTDEFGDWWEHLTAEEQASVRAYVKLLEEYGVALKHPYCSGVETSKHDHMRELRVQHGGRPYRVLYAFDPRRTAVLLVGGEKTGDDRWYDTFVPMADKIYDRHLEQLQKEGEA